METQQYINALKYMVDDIDKKGMEFMEKNNLLDMKITEPLFKLTYGAVMVSLFEHLKIAFDGIEAIDKLEKMPAEERNDMVKLSNICKKVIDSDLNHRDSKPAPAPIIQTMRDDDDDKVTCDCADCRADRDAAMRAKPMPAPAPTPKMRTEIEEDIETNIKMSKPPTAEQAEMIKSILSLVKQLATQPNMN